MKKYGFQLASSLLIAGLYSSDMAAQPKDGFGINAGIANHTMKATGTSGTITGQNWSYSSSGLSIGIDYQIVASEQFSISPFVMLSGESRSGKIRPSTSDVVTSEIAAGHGILGLQIRYWTGDTFFGGHVGSYSEALFPSTATASTGARGPGLGLVAGWEQRSGGLFFMAQLDSATVRSADADVKLGGLRISAGYRFK